MVLKVIGPATVTCHWTYLPRLFFPLYFLFLLKITRLVIKKLQRSLYWPGPCSSRAAERLANGEIPWQRAGLWGQLPDFNSSSASRLGEQSPASSASATCTSLGIVLIFLVLYFCIYIHVLYIHSFQYSTQFTFKRLISAFSTFVMLRSQVFIPLATKELFSSPLKILVLHVGSREECPKRDW